MSTSRGAEGCGLEPGGVSPLALHFSSSRTPAWASTLRAGSSPHPSLTVVYYVTRSLACLHTGSTAIGFACDASTIRPRPVLLQLTWPLARLLPLQEPRLRARARHTQHLHPRVRVRIWSQRCSVALRTSAPLVLALRHPCASRPRQRQLTTRCSGLATLAAELDIVRQLYAGDVMNLAELLRRQWDGHLRVHRSRRPPHSHRCGAAVRAGKYAADSLRSQLSLISLDSGARPHV